MVNNWQDQGLGTVIKYFESVYNEVSVQKTPWVTGAVGIELQKMILDGTFKIGRKVLEIGCGIGTESVYLSKQGMIVTSVEVNKDILKLAKLNAKLYGVDVNFRLGNFLSIDVLAEGLCAFDIVTDQGCFHHIPSKDRENYAKQVNKTLKTGGMYFMRGFSDRMPPSQSGDGPIRLSSDEILKTFLPYFKIEKLYRFPSLPVPGKEKVPQIFWAYLGVKRGKNDGFE